MKKVDVVACALWMKIGALGVELDLEEIHSRLPESDDGVDYPFEEFKEDFYLVKELVYMVFEDRLGYPVPDPDIPEEEKEEQEQEEEQEEQTYYYSETHVLRNLTGNNKRFSWMYHTGSYYGKKLIVKYSDGDEWLIEDGAFKQGEDGNANNYNQKFWFSGNPAQQKDTHLGCPGGCASIFTKPNSNADSVTIYYSKE